MKNVRDILAVAAIMCTSVLIIIFTIFEYKEKNNDFNKQQIEIATENINVINLNKEMNENVNNYVSYYKEIEFPFIKNKEVNVCVIDNFEKKEEYKESHGVRVSMMLNKNYDGDITLYNHKEFNFSNYEFKECDIINYSMAILEENRNKQTLKDVEKFLENYKGILVVASGNEGHTISESQFSEYKSKNLNSRHLNRLIIVGQGDMAKIGDNKYHYSTTSSYGREIDFMVYNASYYIKTTAAKGSSFATPVVTSAVANILSMGVPYEDVKDLIYSGETKFDRYGYYNNVFLMDKAYSNLEKYMIKNKIKFLYVSKLKYAKQ